MQTAWWLGGISEADQPVLACCHRKVLGAVSSLIGTGLVQYSGSSCSPKARSRIRWRGVIKDLSFGRLCMSSATACDYITSRSSKVAVFAALALF